MTNARMLISFQGPGAGKMNRTDSGVLKMEPLSEAAELCTQPDFIWTTMRRALLMHTSCLTIILHNMGDLI